MLEAISEADKSRAEDDRAHPRVGVVVVHAGAILAQAPRGEITLGDHGEYTVLEKKLSTQSVAGATVYTTLEPCTTRNHPKVPCVERLIERRVSRVVIGILDPNQAICGRGLRRLREADIHVDLFPSDLMARVEEQNREFIRGQNAEANVNSATERERRRGITGASARAAKKRRAKGQDEPGAVALIADGLIEVIGLTAFLPSRDFYFSHRKHAPSIDKYVDQARHSVVLVSVNLMTGLPFDGLCAVLERKLEARNTPFSATVSLLNPKREELMKSFSPVLGMNENDLRDSIRRSIESLVNFRSHLSTPAQTHMGIRVHNSIPCGSANILDGQEPDGRIQIEAKAYKAPLRKSFSFELAPTGREGLYQTLVDGYTMLLTDGEEVGIGFLSL